MPRVLFNGSIQGFSGRLGNLIFRTLPDGTTIVSAAPAEKTRREKKRAKLKRSAAQNAHTNHFRRGVYYAKEAARILPVYQERADATPTWTAYNHAMYDWFHPPQIGCLALQEGARFAKQIVVEASDDVLVTKVRVTILDDEGCVLEAGEAVREEGDWWEYSPQAEGKTIIAEAWDLPGNITRLVLE
jgi:hypothetical protein